MVEDISKQSLELIVVMPVYNEAGCLAAVVTEWLDALRRVGIKFLFLILDDGSTDDTDCVLQELARAHPEIELARHKNMGHGKTCIAGYKLALTHDCPWIMQIDSDGQCDPSYLPEFWRRRERMASVQGYRYKREDGFLRAVGTRLLSMLVLITRGSYIRDTNVPYRLMDRDSLAQCLPQISPNVELANVFLSYLYQLKFKIIWVPIVFRPRRGRLQSNLNLSAQIRTLRRLAVQMRSEL